MKKRIEYYSFAWWLVFWCFVVLFVGDLLSGLGFVPQIAPDIVSLAFQLVLLLLSIASVESKRWESGFTTPGAMPVLCFVVVSILSALLNGQGAPETVVFLRAVLGQYIVLLALVNIQFTENEFKRLNLVIFALCAMQIPVAFFRLLTSGADIFLAGGSRSFGTERATGTFGRAAGSMGVTFPLVVIGFLFAFYLWREKKIYVLWMLGFIFFSFCTGKRAFPIVLPFFLFALYFLIRERSKAFSRKAVIVGSVGILGLVGGIFLHPSLNPSQQVGGDIQIKYILDKAIAYETGVTWEGKTSGRFSTSKRLVELATEKGTLAFLLGNGPATLIQSGLIESQYHQNIEDMRIAYGMTGAGWLFAQVGFLGLLCFLWLVLMFFKQTIRIRARLTDPYWRAICGGLIGFHLVILYDTLAYSTTCVTGKLLPALLFLFLAQIMSRKEVLRRASWSS